MFNSNEARVGTLIGLPIGAILTYFLFTNFSWYHNFVMWQLNQPALLVAAALVGFVIALKSDK